jgi:Tol biopolymer transport system component
MKTELRTKRAIECLFLFVLAFCMFSCGGGPPPPPPPLSNPTPSIIAITPTFVLAGGSAFTLVVDGSNFISTSVVRWSGSDRTTTFASSSRVSAQVLGSDIANAGTASVTVFNPSPGGGTSNAITFSIISNPVPAISALNPSSVVAGNAPFTLTVVGASFVSGSTVQWNGSNRPTTFVSPTLLAASIPATDVAVAGTANVTVSNPAPGGGVSPAVMFTIGPFTGNPIPAITSLSDTSAPAGWPGFALTVTGSGFVAASVAQWNGLNHTTTVLSSTQLRVVIPAADLIAVGTAQVSVFNVSPGGGTSNTLDFTIRSVATSAVGVIDGASVAADLSAANNFSGGPAISATGRYVAFSSNESNLVPGDTNNVSDVFLRDTCLGAPAGCTPSVVRVSVRDLGTQGDSDRYAAAISADGRFVAFSSVATNLVPGDTNSANDIFLRDTCIGVASGCAPATSRISVATSGTQANDASDSPSLSADGRFIAFASGASNLVSSDTNNSQDVFLRDTCIGAAAGCPPQTIRISLADNGSQANNGSGGASVSSDGRFVAFESRANNLVASDTNGDDDIFMRDTCVGAPAGCAPSTVRVSVDSSGAQATSISSGGISNGSFLAAISTTGRFVVFTSFAFNLVTGDTNKVHDVFLRDLCFGAPAGCTPSTVRISVASNGSQADASSGGPATAGASISTDGQLVVFGSRATSLVSGDSNDTFDIFVRNTCLGVPAGCTPSTVRLSVALDGTQGDDRSDFPRISADGRFLAFQSYATTLAPGDHGTVSLSKVYVARTGRP